MLRKVKWVYFGNFLNILFSKYFNSRKIRWCNHNFSLKTIDSVFNCLHLGEFTLNSQTSNSFLISNSKTLTSLKFDCFNRVNAVVFCPSKRSLKMNYNTVSVLHLTNLLEFVVNRLIDWLTANFYTKTTTLSCNSIFECNDFITSTSVYYYIFKKTFPSY